MDTTRFGQLTVPEAQIVTISGGLLGFPEYTRYVMLQHDRDEGMPFLWLQSLDHPALAFVMVDPWTFKPDYALELPDDVCARLDLSEEQPPAVFTIVTIPLEPALMTANLQGPIVMNLAQHRAQQVVLADSPYSTRHLILDELWQSGNASHVATSSANHSAV
jgi:flagellar assembly factor FliW